MWIITNLISSTIGFLARIPLPAVFNQRLINWFVKKYDINTDEVEYELNRYNSLSDFFIRNLKAQSRKAEGSFVSPVDGTLRIAGDINDGTIAQVKGKNYSVADLLGNEEDAARFLGGAYYNFYLSPRDYHHVHSPVSGKINKVVHIPGRLLPVNDFTVHRVGTVFTGNERVAIYIDSPWGIVCVVMIGALNVGSIGLSFTELTTNNLLVRLQSSFDFNDKNILINAGDKLGTFYLGSSVVILINKEMKIQLGLNTEQEMLSVKYGKKL